MLATLEEEEEEEEEWVGGWMVLPSEGKGGSGV